MRRGLASVAALLAITISAYPSPAQAQQDGTVTGQVTDATTSAPIASAQIQVAGTQIGGLSNSNGRFVIQRVPAGPQQLRVVVLGYGERMVDVEVPTGGTATVDIQMSPEAIGLEQIVVTATGTQRARQVANQVSQIDASDIVETAPVTNVSQLLSGRAAGVSVLSSAGTAGAGSRIRIRGSSSISLQNDPVIFIDGVRLESSAESGSIGVGGQMPSRLNDLNPEDISSVEIVKGPSAATLYGTDAANGVVRITTKRGRAGESQFRLYVESGVTQDRNDYPANYTGLDAAGDACFAFQVGSGACQQAELESFSPLEDPETTPFKTAWRRQYGLSATGGSDRLTYFVSGEWEQEDGVLGLPAFEQANLREQFGDAYDDLPESQFNPNKFERLSLRANFGGNVAEDLNMRVSTGYVSTDLNLPQNDNNVLGLIPSGILGYSNPETADAGGYGFFLPGEVFAMDVRQEVERFTGSAQFEYDPAGIEWLTARATTGLDLLTRTDIQNVPRGRVNFGATLPLGVRDVNTARIYNYTVDASASASFQLRDDITSRSTVGTQYFRERFTRADAHGENIVAGTGSIGGAVITEAFEETIESKTLGAFVEQEFGFNDNLFVTGAVRGDDNSAFGAEFDFIVYPKVGVSWVVSETGFFPAWEPLSTLRLRGAWGRSGAQPGPTDALRFFTPTAITEGDEDAPGVTFGELGNVDLEPEQSSEIELGLDASFLADRFNMELTYYDKTTTDLLIEVPLAPSAGVGNDRFVNLGEVSNRGWEAGLQARLIQNPTMQWSVGVLASTNDNELVELGNLPSGEPIPTIKQGIQWFAEGYPLGGYWDKPMSFEDANGDGIIEPSEVTVGEEEVFLGSAIPTEEVSFSTQVTLWNTVRISGLLDYRGGHKLRNDTEAFRCEFGICEGFNDPRSSDHAQARALTQAVLPASQRTLDGFVEDASFWKLREVGATIYLPERWAAGIGSERSTLTFTARNLATWTDYSGIDPEVNQFGQDNFLTRDFLTQPPTRSFAVRFDLIY
jgi:TonB-linked SusC/RagA family outer membrane protein